MRTRVFLARQYVPSIACVVTLISEAFSGLDGNVPGIFCHRNSYYDVEVIKRKVY